MGPMRYDLLRWWSRLGLASRVGIAGSGAIAVLVLVALLAGSAGGFDMGGATVARRLPSSSPTPTSTTASATETPTPEPTVPVIEDLQELTREYGDPPDANLGRVRIPKLGVDAPMSARYVDGSVMPLPSGPSDVTWYDMSAWQGMGGEPGQGGNAILGGHVDYNDIVPYAGDVHYRGPAVLNSLRLLGPGDLVEVEYAGSTYTYSVTWIRELSAANTYWGDIWSNKVPVDSVTLYTCGGDFDFETASYSSRTVVRAERLPS